MGVNPHEIVGIRLNDASKQGLMYEHVSKRAKMKKKHKKPNWWHKASINCSKWRKGMYQENQHHGDVFSQVVTSKQAIGRMDATTQANGYRHLILYPVNKL